jgi:hypothetical protein
MYSLANFGGMIFLNLLEDKLLEIDYEYLILGLPLFEKVFGLVPFFSHFFHFDEFG